MYKLLLISLLFFSAGLTAQEICNDAIDNDGDGLIDLNDDDCKCEGIVPSGLIPNPSFEDMNCCPDNKEQLYCAEAWIQASGATTDYVHTCDGFIGHRGIPNANAPLPFPDGQGAIGFRDGYPGDGDYKEYTGSVLISAMEVGKEYRLDFFVGFPDRPQHSTFDIGLFASTNRNSIPFGGNNSAFGCPTNGSGFDQLGAQTVNGNFEWVNVVFEFTATQAYQVMVVGPGCQSNRNVGGEPYYFFDRLALAETADFGIPFSSISGSACQGNIQLTADDDYEYQWYHDGIAILGETNKNLDLNVVSPEGEYLVLLSNDEGCFLSETYFLAYTDIVNDVQLNICEGETYEFGGQMLTTEGLYTEVYSVGALCDSTVNLELGILEHTFSINTEEVCPGESIEVDGQLYDQPGLYEIVAENSVGCDSLIQLIPVRTSGDIVLYEWLDGEAFLTNDREVYDLLPLSNQSYFIKAYNEYDCVEQRELVVVVDPSTKVYLPNIIDLNLSDPDNRFKIGTNLAINRINALQIYDRWGSLMHEYSGDVTNYSGWDGRMNGKKVEQGVYVYNIELEALDGQIEKEAGSFTIIR